MIVRLRSVFEEFFAPANVLLVVAALCASSWFCIGPASGAESTYLLGPQDKLRVRIVEWRAARGEYFEWNAIGGDYTVSQDGTVSVPLLGELPAAGESTSTLAAAISERLKEIVGVIGPVQTSIEVSHFRPFYVLGDVQSPGEYEYRPQLTVLQAVSLAGGRYRPTNAGSVEMASAIGSLEVLDQQVSQALLRRARLQAEEHDQDSVGMPQELLAEDSEPALRDSLNKEQAVLDARQVAFRSEVAALEQLKQSLDKQTASLQTRMKNVEEQVELSDKELGAVRGLVERGLATSGRAGDLQRLVADLRGTQIGWETALLQIRQQIGEADGRLLALRNTRRTEIVVELQKTEEDLQRLLSERATAESLFVGSRALAKSGGRRLARLSGELRYTVTRVENGQARDLPVDESAALKPGDVLKVELALGQQSVGEIVTGTNAGLVDAPRDVEALPCCAGTEEDPATGDGGP